MHLNNTCAIFFFLHLLLLLFIMLFKYGLWEPLEFGSWLSEED